MQSSEHTYKEKFTKSNKQKGASPNPKKTKKDFSTERKRKREQ